MHVIGIRCDGKHYFSKGMKEFRRIVGHLFSFAVKIFEQFAARESVSGIFKKPLGKRRNNVGDGFESRYYFYNPLTEIGFGNVNPINILRQCCRINSHKGILT